MASAGADAVVERARPEPLEDVVREHAEEAAFTWLQRDVAVGDPAYYLDEIEELEEFVEAHLDGLRIAGDAGVAAARAGLGEEEAGEVFVAAVLALERDDADLLAAAREVAEADEAAARGLVSALAWRPAAAAEPVIRDLLAGSPEARRIGLRSAATQALDPGEELHAAFTAEAPGLRAAALRSAAELGRTDLATAFQAAGDDADEACRYWSAWAQALTGLSVEPLLAVASGDSPFAESATALALRRLDPAGAASWIEPRRHDPAQQRLAILGAGASGDPRWIPWLIECMTDPKLSRLAAEAFATIAGADIDEDHLDGDGPEEPDAPETEAEEAEEEASLDDRDSAFEWPDREKVSAWWEARRSSFREGYRYLWGAPIDERGVSHALCEARQTVRLGAALERSRIEPGRPLFRARAPAAYQREWLGLPTR